MADIDLIIENSSFLLTMRGPKRPRVGKEMADNGSIENGAIVVNDGVIIEVGITDKINQKFKNPKKRIDARGRLVLPGFIDPHTHLVFAGSREKEMEMRSKGATYLDILKSGGGIHSTVQNTRKISEEGLFCVSKKRAQKILAHGTTTVEIKSGYGLNRESEEKILNVADRINRELPIDVIKTFLGAHTIPEDSDRVEYITWLKNDAVKCFKGKAEFFDIFCEDGAFSFDETVSILDAARNAGFRLKIHAGQFNDLGAAGVIASSGECCSADHLDRISNDQLKIMAKENTIGVLLPGVPFYLGLEKYPDIDRFKSFDTPVALATDFNPGSCPSYSMQMIISLACFKMKMTPEEALSASTINAAWAIDRGEEIGSLEPGKKADILILDVGTPGQVPYFFGTNLVDVVVKAGKIINI